MVEFIRYGSYSRYHLIWWSIKDGYFVTRPDGYDFNGHKRVNVQDLPCN